MNVHALYAIILPMFRRKRMGKLRALFLPGPETRILDVGGLPMAWNLIRCPSRITLLNVKLPSTWKSAAPNFEFVIGDGTRLDYPDHAFDLVHSNSVIEHVGSFEMQKLFAAEVSRMARKLWVQTPARCFFFEPHLLTPLIHFLPKRWQKRLARNFTLWGWLTRPDGRKVDAYLDDLRLLTYREMRSLFPDCEIRKERFLGMTKAYIAVRA
jgi:hypothetical protein